MIDSDRTDRKILDILQRQGRISMTDLAEQIGFRPAPVRSACGAWNATA